MPPQNSERSRSGAAPAATPAVAPSGGALGGALRRAGTQPSYATRDDLQRFVRPAPRGTVVAGNPKLRAQKRPKFDRDRYSNGASPAPAEITPVTIVPLEPALSAAHAPVSDSALDRLLAARAAREAAAHAAAQAELGEDAVVVPLRSSRRAPSGGINVALHDQGDVLPADAFYNPDSYADTEAARSVEEMQRQFETADVVAEDYATQHPDATTIDTAPSDTNVSPAAVGAVSDEPVSFTRADIAGSADDTREMPATVVETEPPAAVYTPAATPSISDAEREAKQASLAAARRQRATAAALVANSRFDDNWVPEQPFEPVPDAVAAYEAEQRELRAVTSLNPLHVVRRVLMYAAMLAYVVGVVGFATVTLQASSNPALNLALLLLAAVFIVPVAVPNRKVANAARVNLVRIPGYLAILGLVALCAAGFTSGNVIMAVWPLVVFVIVALVRFSPARRTLRFV